MKIAVENAAQNKLVRATVASVFRHTRSMRDGHLILASDSPIDLSRETIRRRLARPDGLLEQVLQYQRKASGRLRRRWEIWEQIDSHDAPWEAGGRVITDSSPLVEYPHLVERVLDGSK